MMLASPSSPSSPSSTGWQAAVKDIDQLVEVYSHGGGGGPGGGAGGGAGATAGAGGGITRLHWVPASQCSHCQGCRVAFSLRERHHHCRRCGGLFCHRCTAYRRRLNTNARPDPEGQLYKVCKPCHEQGPQTVGFAKDWKATFKFFREGGKLVSVNGSIPAVVNLRGRLNFTAECERLKTGYADAIGNASGLKRSISEIRLMVGVPDWQKATHYVLDAMSVKCATCRKEFGLTCSKVQCSICGTATCSKCSSKDLIVYIPDSPGKSPDSSGKSPDSSGKSPDFSGKSYEASGLFQDAQGNMKAKLAIIKIIGCPEVEPARCMYLRVCFPCKDRVEEQQVSEYRRQLEVASKQDDAPVDVIENIDSINTKLREVQHKIDANLPKYQELVDALDLRGSDSNTNSANGKSMGYTGTQSNIQVLAKAQGDMSDHFSQYVMVIFEMKKLQPQTRTQSIILQNVIRAKLQYYHERMWTFRDLRRRLEELTPAAVLQNIQDIVDRNAINGCYVSIKQLAYEALHLVGTYDVNTQGGERVVCALLHVESTVERDLKIAVVRAREDWAAHQACVDELLQVQLKEHRFIRPSRRLKKRLGAVHIHEVLLSRSVSILQQLQLQLAAKTADSSFKGSKEKLAEQEQKLKELIEKDKKQEADWVIT